MHDQDKALGLWIIVALAVAIVVAAALAVLGFAPGAIAALGARLHPRRLFNERNAKNEKAFDYYLDRDDRDHRGGSERHHH
jgi:hypothetical protein